MSTLDSKLEVLSRIAAIPIEPHFDEGMDATLSPTIISLILDNTPLFPALQATKSSQEPINEGTYQEAYLARFAQSSPAQAEIALNYLQRGNAKHAVRFVQMAKAFLSIGTDKATTFRIGSDTYPVPNSQAVEWLNHQPIGYIGNPDCKDCFVIDSLFHSFGIRYGIGESTLRGIVPLKAPEGVNKAELRKSTILPGFGGLEFGKLVALPLIDGDVSIPRLLLYDNNHFNGLRAKDPSSLLSPLLECYASAGPLFSRAIGASR